MQSNLGGPQGNGNGQRPALRIAHRRTPSELTPLMMEQYAIQQQIEALQAQQAMLQNQQAGLAAMGPPGSQQVAYGYPQLQQQQQQQQLNQQQQQQQGGHRRGQSMSMQQHPGPPPAPSSGASGFTEVTHGRRGSQSGHARRHSLALPEAKRAAEKAAAIKQNPSFAFPGSSGSPGGGAGGGGGSSDATPSSSTGGGNSTAMLGTSSSSPPRRSMSPRRSTHLRSQSMAMRGPSPVRGFQFPATSSSSDAALARSSSSGHSRTPSRNVDGNWRQAPHPDSQQQQQQPPAPYFTPGHRARASMSSSISSLQHFGQNFGFGQQAMHGGLPMMPMGGGLMPAQMMQQQAAQQQQLAQQFQQGHGGGSAQQRKSLFSPYLPQATLPALLSDGRLVAGILRVNKKNRSDAYVTTDLLDQDIFICGSKDRNRGLEGDYVAVELLDVDEVWSAKRDKEEKKKRKDGGMSGGGLRRQGSIRDRPDAKKKDDVEVEGQGLLLVDEEEVNDEQKPMYAGHVVAVVERTAGQMFSGTLGVLRPSSAATKEKQDAERRERDPQAQSRPAERPKIVWFKPTDKRVPLIAIPTEQAPADFCDNEEKYKNRIFVACIKRWPITSLHPFGTLVEELGVMGDVSVETEALLRDNSFMAETFSSAVVDAVQSLPEEIDIEGEGRKDFRGENALSIEADEKQAISSAFHIRKTDEGFEVGVHIADVSHFVRSGYALDREARKRGCAVHLVQRTIPMLPEQLTTEKGAFLADQDRRAISIVFKVSGAYELEDSWIGKSVICSTAALTFRQVEELLAKPEDDAELAADLSALQKVAASLQTLRFGTSSEALGALTLCSQLDSESGSPSPVSANIYDLQPAKAMKDELLIRANATVAELLLEKLPTVALLRKQPTPQPKKLDQLVQRAARLGLKLAGRDAASILKSIAEVSDHAVRKALEIFLVKACQGPKYVLPGGDLKHYGFNLPLYCHFSAPFDRYADILTHRQLHAALDGEPYNEDTEALLKAVDLCNTKKDAAHNAQDQSVHLMLCSMVDKLSAESSVIRQAVVINVMDSSFDILLPEFGVEKRVHLDQLPLHKAEFDSKARKLELYWMKGVDSATYIPADQQGKPQAHLRGTTATEDKMLTEKMMELSKLTITDEAALFKTAQSDASPAEAVSQDKPVFSFQDLERRANGDVVQHIAELARVPVVLQADCLFKSPPLLLVRAINPFTKE